MPFKIFSFFCFALLVGCNNPANLSSDENVAQVSSEADGDNHFFPVTSFIKGQIIQIRSAGINPIKVVTQQGRTDTTWIKAGNFDETFREFLTPVIDTQNLVNYFSESKFEDQTLGAFTFMYTSNSLKPDSINIQNWIVYISPETNQVTKIYIVKNTNKDLQLQLTWDTNKSCKIVTISTGRDGIQFVKREENIYWKFD